MRQMRRFGRGMGPGLAVLAIWFGCAAPDQPNLVLITTDTTRADHLGCYGYSRATSPHLDALAAEAVRFEHCSAHAPVTLPSHTSIMTGEFPVAHGARDNGRFVVRDELVTLAERLRQEGYATGAFVSAFVLDSRFGLDQGFTTYDDEYTEEWSETQLRDARIYNQMVTDRSADQTTRRALAWLQGRKQEPFFLWVHYYDPHQRYAPPHPYDQRFQDSPYDGEIAFMDSQIGELLAAVRDQGPWDRTAVIVTVDHGEGLGQHGETTHGVLTHDGTLRVPLIIKPPAAIGMRGAVVKERVAHVDLLPTALAMLGFEPPPGLPGRSLVEAMVGQDAGRERAVYFESILPRFSFGWAPLFGVRAEGWKYIHARRPQLYDLNADPGEIYNVADTEPDRRDAMAGLLFRLIEDHQARADSDDSAVGMSAEVRQKLAALGYAGGGGASTGDLTPRHDDGRLSAADGVAILADYYVANGLAGHGHLRQAAAIYRTTLLPLDPENPSFLTDLANIERRLGRPEQAFELYRRAQALDPEDGASLIALGQLESDAGRHDAADALFESARQLDPNNLTAARIRRRPR